MLYKKYHRNFVRQFRKGVKFKLKQNSKYIRTGTTDPFIDFTFTTRKPYVVVGIDEENTVVILVHHLGRLMKKNCYVV